MNDVNKKKGNGDSKKITITLILVLVIMVTTTGGTYAYFALSATNSTTITGTAATVGLTLNVTEAPLGGTSSNSTKTNVMVPQLESALGTAMGNNYKCVDGNGNTVCKVYTITITNNSTSAVRVIGTIKFAGNNNMSNLKWRRASGVTTLGSYKSNTSALGTTNAYDLLDGTTGTSSNTTPSVCTFNTASATQTGCTTEFLAGNGGSKTYYIVVWIQETGSAQTDNGTFTATIDFNGENGTGVTSTIRS